MPRQTIAAGLLFESGFHRLIEDTKNKENDNKDAVLLDVMCGSGTFLIEAAMMCADVSPYLMNVDSGDSGDSSFKFLKWNNADEELWGDLVRDARAQEREGRDWLKSNVDRVVLAGCDVHKGAHSLATKSLENSGFQHCVRLSHSSFEGFEATAREMIVNDRSIMVINPPFDHRIAPQQPQLPSLGDVAPSLSSNSNSEIMFMELGEFLKGMGKRFETFILFPPSKAYGALKLRRSRSFTFSTARLKLKWLKYDLFGNNF